MGHIKRKPNALGEEAPSHSWNFAIATRDRYNLTTAKAYCVSFAQHVNFGHLSPLAGFAARRVDAKKGRHKIAELLAIEALNAIQGQSRSSLLLPTEKPYMTIDFLLVNNTNLHPISCCF